MPAHRRHRRSGGSFSEGPFNMVPDARSKFLAGVIQALC